MLQMVLVFMSVRSASSSTVRVHVHDFSFTVYSQADWQCSPPALCLCNGLTSQHNAVSSTERELTLFHNRMLLISGLTPFFLFDS